MWSGLSMRFIRKTLATHLTDEYTPWLEFERKGLFSPAEVTRITLATASPYSFRRLILKQ
jgi:hypothetical protein